VNETQEDLQMDWIRKMMAVAVFIFYCGGELLTSSMLLITTVVLIFNNRGHSHSILSWAGFMGCMGETQSYIIGSHIIALLVPAFAVGCFAACGKLCEYADKDGKDAKCCVYFLCYLLACLGFTFLIPGLGFIVYLTFGVPAMIPMMGVVLISELIAIVLTLIFMLPDVLRARMHNGGGLDGLIQMKMGLCVVVTSVVCSPRCAMIYGMGVSRGYAFAFSTMGGMPVHEELGVEDAIGLQFGGGKTATSTLQVAAWVTLTKLIVQFVAWLGRWSHFLPEECKYF
jgi:hypothetical protein